MLKSRNNFSKNGQRLCFLVLGMHRSGTSALSRTLSLMGAALPKKLMVAGEGNSQGHWESQRLADYHDLILTKLQSSWDTPDFLDLTRLSNANREQIKQEIIQIIHEEYGDAETIVIKDPRICRFPEFFGECLEAAGYNIQPVFIFRHPFEVIESLQKRKAFWRNDYGDNEAAILWMIHNLEILKFLENFSRVNCSYASFFKDWRRIVTNIIYKTDAVYLSYDLLLNDWQQSAKKILHKAGRSTLRINKEVRKEVEAFLTGDLRHNYFQLSKVSLDTDLLKCVEELWELLNKRKYNRKFFDSADLIRNRLNLILANRNCVNS